LPYADIYCWQRSYFPGPGVVKWTVAPLFRKWSKLRTQLLLCLVRKYFPDGEMPNPELSTWWYTYMCLVREFWASDPQRSSVRALSSSFCLSMISAHSSPVRGFCFCDTQWTAPLLPFLSVPLRTPLLCFCYDWTLMQCCMCLAKEISVHWIATQLLFGEVVLRTKAEGSTARMVFREGVESVTSALWMVLQCFILPWEALFLSESIQHFGLRHIGRTVANLIAVWYGNRHFFYI
jgi:hypothetical protein